MTVYACLKWVIPPEADTRFGGLSSADRSALELALRLGAARGESVVALTVGDDTADAALREALACGAHRAIRIKAGIAPSSRAVARALAVHTTDASYVCCGDYSLDRGSGSVPPFLAAELRARQACGLVGVELVDRELVGVRRLDGGRRERLRISAPAVVSLEGATLDLRRAPLPAVLSARTARIDAYSFDVATTEAAAVRPYRPRARVLSAPHGESALDRVMDIVGADASTRGRAEVFELEPDLAADRIVESLRQWGYLE